MCFVRQVGPPSALREIRRLNQSREALLLSKHSLERIRRSRSSGTRLGSDEAVGEIGFAFLVPRDRLAKDLPILEDEQISREKLLHRRQDIASPGCIAGFQYPLHLAKHRIADEARLSSIRRLLEEPFR